MKAILEIHNFTQNKIDEKFFQKTAQVVLEKIFKREKLASRPELKSQLGDKIEISLAVVGDGRMRRLNKMYRGKNRVTDVLAFSHRSVLPYLVKAFPPVGKKTEVEFVGPPDGIERLGEVVICYPRAKKQAKRMGHSLEKELTLLFTHGLLHLLGYDHEKDIKEAEEMRKLEEEILSDLF